MTYPDPVPQSVPQAQPWHGNDVSSRTILPAFLLCFFLGTLGAHRFYVARSAPRSP